MTPRSTTPRARINTPRCRGPLKRCLTIARCTATGLARSPLSNSNAAGKLLDKATANRWRAVLKTAIALETAERDPSVALTLAQEALALAPGLVPPRRWWENCSPPAAIIARRRKSWRRAYRETPHPDLAAAYLKVRRGDSALDKLERARALAKIAPFDAESQMTIARAALDAKNPLRRP